MGEEQHSDRETLADVSAIDAARGDPSACTVGVGSADSGPAALVAAPGAGSTAGTVADSPGSYSVASDTGATPRTEPTFDPPPDPAAATVDGMRDAGGT